MAQKDNPAKSETIVAIVSDATLLHMVKMEPGSAFLGAVTDHFPREKWDQVSRVMNFVELWNRDEMPLYIDEENIVVFHWPQVKVMYQRQGLYLDRSALEGNVPKNQDKKQKKPKNRFFGISFTKRDKGCGCKG
jgi:hypothetical protein